eukprot:gb/GEZN01004278.1/.p1 GENE.gb/GEZN01004278.1/~~gb/GEZN01004278.1/.p1  ORF type:complete len:609 (+),score=118.66 gb/GEZN01004278.1/:98-1924(+)
MSKTQPSISETNIHLFSLSRLEKEPIHLEQQSQQLQRAIEDLAVEGYRSFVQTSHSLHAAHGSISHMDAELGGLIEGLARFQKRGQQFQAQATRIRRAQALNRHMMHSQIQLMELLELPQLMETCVRSDLYEQALDLHDFARTLLSRYPSLPIVQDISQEMNATREKVQHQLLEALRGPLQLPKCLSVVGHLRRLQVFSEQEMRERFLGSRDAFLSSLLVALQATASSPYDYLSKYLDLCRLHIFDMVTQYRAVFLDDTSAVAEEKQEDDKGLLYCWTARRVALLLDELRAHLPQATFTANLLQQAMYCGVSLVRVGADFRELLPAIFEQHVMDRWEEDMEQAVARFAGALHDLDWHLPAAALAKLGIPLQPPLLAVLTSKAGPPNPPQTNQPPKTPESSSEDGDPVCGFLTEYPPLVVAANSLVNAFNRLRQAPLISLQTSLVDSLSHTLQEMARTLRKQQLLDLPSSSGNQQVPSQNPRENLSPLTKLATAHIRLLLPFANQLLKAFFRTGLVEVSTEGVYDVLDALLARPSLGPNPSTVSSQPSSVSSQLPHSAIVSKPSLAANLPADLGPSDVEASMPKLEDDEETTTVVARRREAEKEGSESE